MKKGQIYYLSKEDVLDKNILKNHIYPNLDNNYYWSDNFDADFYISLAKAGFITVTYNVDGKIVLLPEIQKEYSVLDFRDMRIPKKVKKLIDKNLYTLKFNTRFDEVLQTLKTYHQDSWIEDNYINLLKSVYLKNDENFSICSVELIDKKGNLIAGEVGYNIGKIYTSLSGFFKREKEYNNCGKLQLVLLGLFLQQNEFSFWNLGHPYMEYKYDLGAKIYDRIEFLYRWFNVLDN